MKAAGETNAAAKDSKTAPVVSMHENVEVWEDCCCCEAEPYWIEAMADMENEKPKE